MCMLSEPVSHVPPYRSQPESNSAYRGTDCRACSVSITATFAHLAACGQTDLGCMLCGRSHLCVGPAQLHIWRCLPSQASFQRQTSHRSHVRSLHQNCLAFAASSRLLRLIGTQHLQGLIPRAYYAPHPKPHRTTCQQASAHPETKDAAQRPKLIYAVAAGSLHDMPGHPECAARIPAIMSALEKANLTSAARSDQVSRQHCWMC